ncbi:CDP-diacylglycerol--serine O-phosphatidyltransferase [bacterium]|nr:CDP-diacylglycerol--serine O-phosphatidyltransferase [bacterium]
MKTRNFFTPSLFTFLNFFWGSLSIIESLEGNIQRAAWFIIIAVLCDGMDGKLARWTHSETTFGFELDSLADLVSCGLAPAIVVYVGVLRQFHFLGFSVCFLYIFAGGYRLARFNAVQKGDRSRGYIGLPIPVAGITVASLWIYKQPFHEPITGGLWIVLMLFFVLMMLSTIPYDWPKITFGETWWKKMQSAVILVSVLFMAIFPQKILFPIFILYILLGIKNRIISLLRGQIALVELILPIRKSNK